LAIGLERVPKTEIFFGCQGFKMVWVDTRINTTLVMDFKITRLPVQVLVDVTTDNIATGKIGWGPVPGVPGLIFTRHFDCVLGAFPVEAGASGEEEG